MRGIFGATSVALAIPTLVLGLYWAPVYDFVASSLLGSKPSIFILPQLHVYL